MFSSLLELAERVMGPVGGLSPLQRTFVKTVSGEDLSKEELKLWRAATGRTGMSFFRRSYSPKVWSEVWLICGRRSFKTTFGAILCAWEATRRTPPDGQVWKIPILCPGLRQGQKGSLDVVRSTVKAIPELAELLVADSEEALTFSTGIEVLTLPPKIKLVQGWTCPLIWCDEANNFSQEDASESALADVLDATRPSIATIPGARIYVSSLPGPDTGTIFEQWENRFSGDALIFKADSVAMNPSLEDSEEYRKAKKRRAYWDLYYSGNFVKARSGLLPADLVEAAIQPAPPTLQPYGYVAALGCDFATGTDSKSDKPKAPDDCAAVIAVKTSIDGVEKIAVVWTKKWSVKAGQIHPVLTYMEEISKACAQFNVRQGVGDQKSLAAAVQFFGQRGIHYEHLVTNGSASEPVFDYLRTELNEGLLLLPDDPTLKAQLISLEERRDGGRSYEVAATGSKKDDLATAAAAAIFKVGSLPIPRAPICEAVFEWQSPDPEERFWLRQQCRERERIPSFSRNR